MAKSRRGERCALGALEGGRGALEKCHDSVPIDTSGLSRPRAEHAVKDTSNRLLAELDHSAELGRAKLDAF